MQRRELRGVLWLLPLLAVGAFIAWQARKITRDELRDTSEPAVQIAERRDPSSADASLGMTESADGQTPEPFDKLGTTPVEVSELFNFDPNTVSYHDLLRLGFTRGEALGIVKYRERGKVFEIAEDFAACYQVTEAMYGRLEPYIIIGEAFRLKKFPARERNAAGGSRTKPAEANEMQPSAAGGFGLRSSDEDHGRVERPERPREDVLVDLNSADTTALVSVNGIGSLTAARIVEYRARLGGFVDAVQLAEVRGVTEQNFERILPQIFVDMAAVQKINVNFAPAKVLATHPYIEAAALRKLLKLRQLKGGWNTPEELKSDNVFTTAQLEKLLPYLDFEQ